MTDNFEGGDLVALASVSAVALFTDEAKYTEFYQRVRAETVDNAPPVDTATAKGREAVIARAFKVTKAKTALDKTAKDLTEEWRTKTNLVNAARRKMIEELAALADEVRAPVTAWEEAEKARVARVDTVIANIRAAAVVQPDETAAAVRNRGLEVWESHLDESVFQDRLPEAQAAKDQTVALLRSAFQRLTQEEADRAELAALRAEREAREAREAEEARQRVEAEQQALAAAEAEQRARDAAEAQAAAIQRAKDDAAAAAIVAERQKVQEAAAEAQRQADAALAAEKKRADDLAREQKAKDDAAAAAIAAEAKRAADRAHVSAVMTAAKEAIMHSGAVDEPTAKLIVLAIKAGEIPAVKMEF